MENEKIIQKLSQAKQIIVECLQEMSGKKAVPQKRKQVERGVPANGDLDYSMPLRPFIKRHASKMSGPKKFILILAYLAKGNLKAGVKAESVQKEWNKATSLLGGKFNWFYTGAAKDNDWVESKKQGSYNLRPAWREIFK
jgi:hypothetical protein